ncbi:ATP phosphoribosyltransferase regulatory subunit [Pseudaestuariivita atlantica]|uniref:Histidine--tRNA ligase n=1 Tax=Pseudaestuariivita atlantica TaxID=1317121 RepID=A0A0L1JU68_9RHOB|nr:ATP phosphoribosyltransferase regulatory subunit [Pseudaestuariivita atlantica]KNG94928.1 ATP phosphoribosyltransferase [Pseudaestuariivita atlantica]
MADAGQTTDDARLRARVATLMGAFRDAGGVEVSAPVLLPAEALLDLYGEDIRGRAYVTSDALRGEQMLRPDFTVPVVQRHMAEGAEPARYAYAGPVFRKQEQDPSRANEYPQVGYEVFARSAPAETDAEVFALIAAQLDGLPVRAVTGDIGILMAAVRGLETTDRRRTALMRHIWRPRRFRALLDRFAGRTPVPASRARLLAEDHPWTGAAPQIGLRGRAEVEARIAALREDAAEPPLAAEALALLDALLAVRETCDFAIERLRDLSVDLVSIRPAVDRLAARLDALDARGFAPGSLEFEANYGRTSMEYYDGFVFGFYATRRPDWPPVATGGRYDALTERLGQGAGAIPAVGGVVRPDLVVALDGAGT